MCLWFHLAFQSRDCCLSWELELLVRGPLLVNDDNPLNEYRGDLILKPDTNVIILSLYPIRGERYPKTTKFKLYLENTSLYVAYNNNIKCIYRINKFDSFDTPGKFFIWHLFCRLGLLKLTMISCFYDSFIKTGNDLIWIDQF